MTNELNAGVRLGCERLESRENPAGNIAVGLGLDGVLYLRGDPAANLVSIQQNPAGDIHLIGVSGTTVNGAPVIYVGRGWLNGVQVIADDGNDLIEMVGLRVNGTISVLAGNENDGVALYGVAAGGLNLQMQGGHDVVVTDGVSVAWSAHIDGGTGFDTVDYRTRGLYAPAVYMPHVERLVGGPFGY